MTILGLTGEARAQEKVALVIGNGAYQNVPELPNPPHDAADIAAAFGRLGFSVHLVTNAGYEDMRRALLKFGPKARNAKMAVVFFAGHGMEMDGENWLIPTDAELKTDLEVDQEAISLHGLMLMVSASSELGLVILDACRNNPFLRKMKRTVSTRSLDRGLGAVEPANNVLVAYSAKDGTTAADGDGRNSPFTTALLKYLEVPGLEINFMFRDVRDAVIASTGGEQQPFTYGSLSKEAIYFKPPLPAQSPTDEVAVLLKQTEARIAALEAAQEGKSRPDMIAWSLLDQTTDEGALKRFIGQYPTSPLRKDAEARIAALKAAEAAKPVPPRPDEVTWLLLKETTDEGALKGFIAQYPTSPLRKDAQARIAALEAARAAQPKAPSPEEIAWKMVKDSTDPDELRRFVKAFPGSARRAEAEREVAALTSAAANPSSANTVDPHALALSLQFELKRVGCFDGALNGEFDTATRAASRNFAKLTSIKMPDELSPGAIKAVQGIDKRVCPLVCPEGHRAHDDRCVAIAPPHKAQPHKAQRHKEGPQRAEPHTHTAAARAAPTLEPTREASPHASCRDGTDFNGVNGNGGKHRLSGGGCGY